LSPIVVWQEIFSFIKGSVNSHEYPNGYFDEHEYLNRKSLLDLKERKIIYKIFRNYTQWLLENNLFDLMDVVNHLLNQTKYKTNYDIHYLMCDECQDLTPAAQYLLLRGVKNSSMMLGDTA